MSSILTNHGSMSALSTLRSINQSLDQTRVQIATGKSVASSAENASIWAVSKVMESDVAGFKKISESLALGDSTVAVARQGAEAITTLLTDMKNLVASAQVENVDREKIQNNIGKLKEQIQGIVGTASFNGQNLLQNTGTEAGSGKTSILSSLDRSQSSVSGTHIAVRRRDLGTGAAAISASGGSYTADVVTGTLNAARSATLDVSAVEVEAGAAYSLSIVATDGDSSSFDATALNNTATASQTQTEMAANEISYVARDGDTMSDVSRALTNKFASYAARNEIDSSVLNLTSSGSKITATSGVTNGTDTIAIKINVLESDAENTIGGGLDVLNDLDVTTDEGARTAMGQIEGLIQTSIDSAAALGSDQGRLETQSDFISKLSTSLRSGIGQLIDADMIETSARLQALQVQQQLAVNALSIANDAPRAILGLFR
ncbi:flagellin [Puniceibacterium sediminis]|uniref:Flagellin n=1 Tax=Puniceibacterium sediminis TaxID=1608407 RepID=A0A238XA57_9RHOB|nr:flagellin [Puniceibacterium sediminis]SNR55451.1 flagellin [Puniceibacterium sediminis]